MKYTILLFCLSAFGLYVLQTQNLFVSSERPPVYLPPPASIKQMSFGYDSFLADVLWLRYMQDVDACGKKTETTFFPTTPKKKGPPLAVQIEEEIFSKEKRRICHKSWTFHLLRAITTLDPKFYKPYLMGGISLSVFLEDPEGAEIIFDKGVKQFPKDWRLLFYSAYHSLYEMRKPLKAAELLSRAALNGAPLWVSHLAAKLYSRQGQLELGLRSLEAHKRSLTDPQKILWIQKKLDRLYKDFKRLKNVDATRGGFRKSDSK